MLERCMTDKTVDNSHAQSHARLHSWLRDAALPLWIDRGFDHEAGGFHERLDFDSNPIALPRRLTVQARQIFVYARAILLGWAPDNGHVQTAFKAMVARYRNRDGQPGFAFTVAADGTVVDGKRDLYAHAFVLLAASAYFRLTGDAEAIALADETLAFIDEAMVAPNGGYLDYLPNPPARLRQNPHMHLFEALLALYEATGDAAYLGRAGEIYGLFRTRFFQPATGTIAEYFGPDWAPEDGANAMWEPGHHMEWAWLLTEYERLTGTKTRGIVDRLLHVAYTHGVSADGVIIDEVRGDGTALKKSARTWPLTEAAKAQAVRLSHDPLAAGRLALALDGLHDRYLAPVTSGLWHDHFAEDGTLLTDYAPASTLYHIAMSVFVVEEALKGK
jgi:mannose/cellobiose epimerase-like protein (N-acyl-D-glucosamine 2-epimerase family)